ncbi:NAD-dependent epimerase/dehydratase family protein [Murimonas intestini]|uniref:Dihydroflavonol-4-reductase n=1 Tax=Murimonas intestini TaxID=1337051 RepID=A0AB73SYR5_9FIRM|nr:NAD-dependent epimerase/dehydratase family protein [Murimonas intestini]MCR1843045.1 NAD-dependent epimerase/dehydratase family protein [Murimonas intestini]MCR1868046.1 NAD-dependent epimerase/dehydratase family protein [Murimonas intestini]MCR1885514.1 NAD-dependent epimerase/dehydratase family protein [Murimonas intestini]
MKNRIYLITGAAGFLGSHVCEELLERGERVRALVLNGDKSVKYVPKAVEIVTGDLCDVESLDNFFTVDGETETIVIHCASMVTVDPAYNQKLMDVNVGGTKNIIDQCLKHKECRKLVYVSSTGAIPELPKGQKIKEVYQFTPIDKKKQVGCYSQSKAIATQAVLDAVNERGLNACIVHPSGILGPKDYAVGQTTGVIIQIMNGEMPIGMAGSFNLCDVRDLAHGCVAAADKGRKGQCYILGNKEVTLKEVCRMLKENSQCSTPLFYLPIKLAMKIAGSMEKKAQKTGKMPIMTTFAVYNLDRNNTFDYSKAEQELGYTTRPYEETLQDEVNWLIKEGLIKERTVSRRVAAE